MSDYIGSGDEDFICNWLGNKAWTKALAWDSKDAFNKAADNEWQTGNKTVARHRSAGAFHFMQAWMALDSVWKKMMMMMMRIL